MQSLSELPMLKYLSIPAVLADDLKPSNGCLTALQTLIVADPELAAPETDDLFRSMAFTLLPKHTISRCLEEQPFGLLGMLSISQCSILAEPAPLRLVPCLTRELTSHTVSLKQKTGCHSRSLLRHSFRG